MASTVTQDRAGAARDQATVREVLDEVRADGREGLATSADEAVSLSDGMGYPVVAKIVSPDILHKTEAKGVLVGLGSSDEVSSGYEQIVENAKAYNADADITGVQVQ